MTALAFFVEGRPQTAGSKRAVPINRNGERVGTRVIEDGSAANREAKRSWRQDVQLAARVAMSEQGWELTHGPVVCEFVFYRHRPASHYGKGRNARDLKPTAPAHPTGKPDALKLARAAEDSLTGLVWADDAQVVDGRQAKVWSCRYSEREGVSVTIASAVGQWIPFGPLGLPQVAA